jgi:hypothetical protein
MRGGQARTPGANAGSDPLAELARLIGQSDPFGEYGRDATRQPAAPQPAAPVPPQTPVYAAPAYSQQSYAGAAPGADSYAAEPQVPAYLTQHGGYEADPYHQGNVVYDGEEQDFYDDVPPSRRRMGIVVIAGVFALAVLGTAGAFGYRAIFGSSSSGPPPVIKADTAPSKIVPANARDSQSKLITDRINASGQGEKVVSREEQPVDIKDQPAGSVFPPGPADVQSANSSSPVLGSGVVGTEPKKVHTIAIRPDARTIADASPNGMPPIAAAEPQVRQAPPLQVAPSASEREPAPRPTAARAMPPVHRAEAPAPGNAPLSLNPNVPAARRTVAPARTASIAPTRPAPSAATGSTGGYAVQVTSQRSESEARAAFRSLQGKYPGQLGGKQSFIHKVSLGAKGVYYRAMVGPFASASAASALCSSLKAAGGQCIVQRN